MASDKTADKTVTPERIVAEAMSAAVVKERAPREHAAHSKAGATALALGALGVVYGDIGTSPLYSLKEAFTEKSHRLTVDQINVYGVCSLAFWSLVIIISIKYLMLVMRADNNGEGGILALTALVMPKRGRTVAKAGILVSLGVFGTSLLYGDGIITPAISVLSAVEGLEEVSTSFKRWVIPIAIIILIGLFGVQRRGTGAVGRVFGPVMMIWFATIAMLGLWHISDSPGIIKSRQPLLRGPLLRPPEHEGLLVAWFDLPGRDGWRSALCRHGPLRPATDRAGLVRHGSAVAPAELLGPGGLPHRPPRGRPQRVLPNDSRAHCSCRW